MDVDVDGHSFSAMLIESAIRQEWLQEGNPIDLVFKETEVPPYFHWVHGWGHTLLFYLKREIAIEFEFGDAVNCQIKNSNLGFKCIENKKTLSSL